MATVIEEMKLKMPDMSKSQKKLARFISMNTHKAAFFTASELAQASGVSESTVVRFAVFLGYKGFPGLQDALEVLVKTDLKQMGGTRLEAGKYSRSEILQNVLLADLNKIKLTLEQIDYKAFEQAVNDILKAKKIYVIGLGSSAPLSAFLCYYLELIFDNVKCITTSSLSEIFEQMINIGSSDLIIGLSFPRYSMRTLKAMEFANSRNANVITISDSKNSPMSLYSSCNLIAKTEMATVVDSLVAPLSVINALIVALYLKKQKAVTGTLEKISKACDDYQFEGRDEINLVDEEVKLKFSQTEIDE